MDYKEKLRLAKEALESGSYDKDTIEYIFPELAESKDERVRNKLIEFFKGYCPDKEWWGNITQRDILAWLEKYGEQKYIIPKFKVGDIITDDTGVYPNKKIEAIENENYVVRCLYTNNKQYIPINTQDEYVIVEKNSSEWSIEDEMQLDAAIHLVSGTGHIETANWLKALKDRVQPQQGWSEEDKVIRNALIKFVELLYSYGSGIYDLDKKQFLDWLQKLENRISK